MTLFSWFTGNKNQGRSKKKIISFEQEVAIFRNNTMWPIAKIRQSTVATQHEYINNLAQKKPKYPLLRLKVEGFHLNH